MVEIPALKVFSYYFLVTIKYWLWESVMHDWCGTRSSYFDSHRAPPAFGHYQFMLLGVRGMCANNLPKVVTWQWNGWESSQ